MVLLRRPIARSTVAAVVVTDVRTRDLVADLTLGWIDSLAPIISARRPPGRWSRARRAERDARFALDDALQAVPDLPAPPQQVATMLAAGVQVPIPKGDLASPIKGSKELTDAQVTDLMGGKWYFNVHTKEHPAGEIRGQVMPAN